MPGRFGRRLGRACGPLGPAPSARGGSGCRQGPAPTARYQTGAGICNFFGGVSSFRGSVFAGPHPRPLPPAQTGVPFPAGRRDGTQKLLTPRKKVQVPRVVWYRPARGRRRAAIVRTVIMQRSYQYDPRIISVTRMADIPTGAGQRPPRRRVLGGHPRRPPRRSLCA